MLRINGLFGWVSYNDRRSVALFVSFVLAFHVLAAAILVIPLAIMDPAHAPMTNWVGYAQRYLPAMTLVGAGLFLVQFWWHVNLIRRRSSFKYTYKVEEPRLCRIAEPLVIAAGLPEPRLAIIESPALNAFACGLSETSAVLVFTRGLLNGLDDDELAGVIAHELMHIKNGDLRLMAAATVCQRSMAVLYNQGSWGGQKYREATSLGVSLLVLPVLFLVFVAISFLRHSAIHFGHITRTLISSAREFMADSKAMELTQDPAALVSALRKIEGRSLVDVLPAEHDAMMIDGPSKGTFATHPSIAERIAAIIRLTGSMTAIAPARRDTRPVNLRQAPTGQSTAASAAAFGLRQRLAAARPAAGRESRVEAPSDRNVLGFTREMNIAACISIAAFLVINRADLHDPRELAAHFDFREFSLVMSAIAKNGQCVELQAAARKDGKNFNCEAEVGKELAEHKGKSFIGKAFTMMASPSEGTFALPNGGFSTVTPESVRIETSRKNTCFNSARYSVGDRGFHSIHEPQRTRSGSDISMPRYLGYVARSVDNIGAVGPEQRDAMLKSYVKTRQLMNEVVHRFFGEPGLDVLLSTYQEPEHEAVVAMIRDRLDDPAFSQSLSPIERHDYALLTSDPDQFITCVARKTRPLA